MSTDSFTTLRIERDASRIRHLIIDVPGDPLNRVTTSFHDELLEALRELRQDVDARAIIISANGRNFSGGGHLTELFEEYGDIRLAMRHHQRAAEITTQLLDIPAPVISAVQGAAVGLGSSVAMLSDFLVMAEGAQIVDPHVRAGLVAGDGGTIGFPYAMSMQQAKKHLLLCRPLTANEALRTGIAIEVVPQDTLLETAQAIAEEISALPPLAVRHTKQALNAYFRASRAYTVDVASAWEHMTFRTQDHVEAINAFLEKRPASYESR